MVRSSYTLNNKARAKWLYDWNQRSKHAQAARGYYTYGNNDIVLKQARIKRGQL